MELQDVLQFIRQKWQTVVFSMFVMMALAFIVTVLQPQKYGADQRLLLVQSFATEVDPYAATRSTEFLTGLLSEVVYSQAFLDDVLESGYILTNFDLPQSAEKRMKEWQKTLRVSANGDTGILDISVYYTDPYTTEQLALAVRDVLQSTHTNYHSRGNAVVLQSLDTPNVSDSPVQPNTLLGVGAGAVFGALLGLAYVYAFPNKELILFGSKQPNLVDIRGHDWSAPVAHPYHLEQEEVAKSVEPTYEEAVYEEEPQDEPTTTQEEKRLNYEEAEMKNPYRHKEDVSEPQPKASPPPNLPIA